jgi:hypothetical protein
MLNESVFTWAWRASRSLDLHFFPFTYLHGGTERCTLTMAAEICAVLEDAFRITLPRRSQFAPALQRLIEPFQQAWSRAG